LKTAEYISQRCGVKEIQTQSGSTQDILYDPDDRDPPISVSTGYSQGVRPLLHPHEVANLSGREMLVFGENLGLIHGGRRSYLEMSECRGKYRPDPYHAKRGRA
jgi:type IV secretory pathway TraG/TraD family ATPase VirD4